MTFEDVQADVDEQMKLLQEMGVRPEEVRLGYRPYGVVYRYIQSRRNHGEPMDSRLKTWHGIPIVMVDDDDLIEVIACLQDN